MQNFDELPQVESSHKKRVLANSKGPECLGFGEETGNDTARYTNLVLSRYLVDNVWTIVYSGQNEVLSEELPTDPPLSGS